jgi:pimeloyl-ACP methyl ester carboxylesterase
VAAGERELLANSPEVVSRDLAACDRFDVMNRVADIRLNSLIICGKQDKMTPIKYSEYLASKLPQSRLVLIDRAGHNVMLEKPDLLNHALREWLLVQ